VEVLLRGRPPEPFTQADLDRLPELPGYRFELIDGLLIVSPSAVTAHQRLARELFVQLHAACPEGVEVFFAPLDVKPTAERTFVPDLIVSRTADVGERWI